MKALKKIIKGIFYFVCFFFLSFCLLIFLLFLYLIKDVPRPDSFQEALISNSTKIYDRTGKILLYEIFGEERRIWVSKDKVPDYLIKAILAAEDANFYSHRGIDIKAIIRAILEDLKIKKPLFGGSTITQQLIRTYFFTTEKTIKRKVNELILAMEIERKYSKDQILEWYLNSVPFGRNAYGVGAASQIYFGKEVEELSIGESAALAAMIKAPSLYTPDNNEGKKRLETRKNYIIKRMVTLGFLTEEVAKEAIEEKLEFKEKKVSLLAPYFTLWVKEILEKKYGKEFLTSRGLKVYTSLDFELQKIAEEVVKKGIERNKKYGAHNACLVAIDPRNGEVLAMTVGTGNYYDLPQPQGCQPGKTCKFDPQVNVCLIPRRPGSAFKPFVYLLAFKKGYDDKMLILDAPTNFGKWGGKEYIPQNYDGLFRGWVNLRSALAQSLNIPSVKILYLIGIDKKIESLGINNFSGLEKILQKGVKETLLFAQQFGISSIEDLESYGPSIVLGGIEISPLELTGAYASFGNEGKFVKINPILKIEDAKGNVIFEAKKSEVKIIEKKYVDLLIDILSDNEARAPIFGLNSPLYIKEYKVPVKTGTAQDFKDLWTVGFVPSLAVGVWVGNNDDSPIMKEPGVRTAAPIWKEFLEKVLPNRELNSF